MKNALVLAIALALPVAALARQDATEHAKPAEASKADTAKSETKSTAKTSKKHGKRHAHSKKTADTKSAEAAPKP
jgi:hypothetical protein